MLGAENVHSAREVGQVRHVRQVRPEASEPRTMRILVTGGSGMLGSYVATQAAERGWETWATYHGHEASLPGCSMLRVNVVSSRAVMEAVRRTRPEVIIHTAADAQPDHCERHKKLAMLTNVSGTRNIIRAAEKFGARMVHVSTDLVFRGRYRPYQEDDETNPPNQYGVTKRDAELCVRKASVPWAIVRTSVIYGPRMFPHLGSFSDKVIESIRAGKPVKGYVDQYRCAIPAWNLADALLEIAERKLTGVFHAVCPEASSRYAFAARIAEEFGLDTSLLVPSTMDEVPSRALRPNMIILDTSSTQARLETRLLGFEEGIRELRARAEKAAE